MSFNPEAVLERAKKLSGVSSENIEIIEGGLCTPNTISEEERRLKSLVFRGRATKLQGRAEALHNKRFTPLQAMLDQYKDSMAALRDALHPAEPNRRQPKLFYLDRYEILHGALPNFYHRALAFAGDTYYASDWEIIALHAIGYESHNPSHPTVEIGPAHYGLLAVKHQLRYPSQSVPEVWNGVVYNDQDFTDVTYRKNGYLIHQVLQETYFSTLDLSSLQIFDINTQMELYNSTDNLSEKIERQLARAIATPQPNWQERDARRDSWLSRMAGN